MSEEEKAAVKKNFERWQKLSPDERERLRERWQRWRELPPKSAPCCASGFNIYRRKKNSR